MSQLRLLTLCSTFLNVLILTAWSDALVVTRAMTASTIAQVYIEKEQVRTELEIGWADVAGFKNLLPLEIHEKLGYEPTPLEDRLRRFFTEDLVFEADGAVLRGQIQKMEIRKRVIRDVVTGVPVIQAEGADDILFVEILHPLENRPETFSLKPPQNEIGAPEATIGFMVYHQGLPVNDFRYLGREEMLRLDWEDPWYSQFENRNLWRQYNEAINAFLYVEPFETRIEVVVRPKDIQEWTDLGIQGLSTLPADKQAEIKEKTAAFILSHLELEIDGKAVEPELQRIHFLKRTLRSSVVIDPPEELDAISATLGIIYTVPNSGLPNEARLIWNLFSPKQKTVRAAATDEAGPLPYRLMPDDNVLVWKNYLKNPTIPGIKKIEVPNTQKWVSLSIGLPAVLIIMLPVGVVLYRWKGRVAALIGMVVLYTGAIFILPQLPRFNVPLSGKAPLQQADQQQLVSGLLGNVYAAFDFSDENGVYDALSQSLAGDLLNRVYLETIKSLELKSQGGARVKVKEVMLNEAAFIAEGDGFSAACNWDVRGSVGHWGHVHERINRYEAKLMIEPSDGAWKITSLEMHEEQRVQ